MLVSRSHRARPVAGGRCPRALGWNGCVQREEGSRARGCWVLPSVRSGREAAQKDSVHERHLTQGLTVGQVQGGAGGVRPVGGRKELPGGSILCVLHTAHPWTVSKQGAGQGSPWMDICTFPPCERPTRAGAPVHLCTRAVSPGVSSHLCAPYPFIECLLYAAVPRSTARTMAWAPSLPFIQGGFPVLEIIPLGELSIQVRSVIYLRLTEPGPG